MYKITIRRKSMHGGWKAFRKITLVKKRVSWSCSIKLFQFLYLCRHNDNSLMSTRFKRRVIVLSCLGLGLYPFLWAWTVIGCIWFTNSRNCVSNGMNSSAQYFVVYVSHIWLLRIWQIPEGQKWGFLVWLIFSYSALICIASLSTGKVYFYENRTS